MEPLDLKSLEPESGDWRCVTDGRLLAQLDRLGANLEGRAQQILDKFDTLDQRVAQSQTKFDNVTNEFLLLSNTQFIENRVYDEADPKVDEDYTAGQIKPMIELSDEEKQKIYEANVQRSLEIGLNFVSEAFDHVKIDVSDSEDEIGDVPLLREPLLEAKNPYQLRRLPYLIGSDSFLNDDFAGVGGSKPSAASAQSDVESELSEDEIEPQSPIGNLAQPTAIGRPVSCEDQSRTESPANAPTQSTLFDSDSDDDLFHGSSQKFDVSPPSIGVDPVATPKLDFATELTRKLKVPPTDEPKSDPPSLPTLPKPKKPNVNELTTPTPAQVNLKKPNLFGDLGESDSDDLFSSPVVIKTPKKSVVSSKPQNLFGDSSDSGEDDLLFSSKIKPPIPNNQATKPRSQGFSGATTTNATTDRPTTSIRHEEGARDEEEEDLPNALLATSSSKAHAQDAQGGQGQQSKQKETKKKGAVQKASLFSDSESDDDDFLLFASKDPGGSLRKDSKQLFELSDEAESETQTMSEIRPKKPIGGVAMFSPGVDILGALNKRNSAAGKTDLAHNENEGDTMDGNAPSSGKKAVKTVIKKVKRTKTMNNKTNNNNNASDSNESDSHEAEANENTDDEAFTVASFEVDPPPKAVDVPTAVKKGPPVALKPSFKAATERSEPSINSGEDSSSNSSSPKPSRSEGKSPPPVAPKPVSKPEGEPPTSAPPPLIAPKPILSPSTIEEKARNLVQPSPTTEQRAILGTLSLQDELSKSDPESPSVTPQVPLNNNDPSHSEKLFEDPLLSTTPDPLEASSSIRLEPDSECLRVVDPNVVMEIKRSPTMSEDELSSKEPQSPHEGSPSSSINRPGGTVSKSAFRSSLEKALIKGPMSPKTPPISPTKKIEDEVVFRNPDESDVNEKSGPRVSDPPSDGEVSFTGHLLVGANKIRAKGSVKRRPPTRRSRLFDALPINEGSDMEDAVDSATSEGPKEARAEILPDLPEVIPDKEEEKSHSSPTNSDRVQGDGDGNIIDEKRPFSPDDPSKKPPPMPEAVKASNHSIFDTSSDDDDLFAQPTPLKLNLPKSEVKLFASDSSSDDDLFKK